MCKLGSDAFVRRWICVKEVSGGEWFCDGSLGGDVLFKAVLEMTQALKKCLE